MSGASTPDPSNPVPRDVTTAPEPPRDGLAQLRRLLLTPEQGQLTALQQRMDDPRARAADVAEVVAEAISLRAGRDDLLTTALAPTVEGVLRSSVRRNPAALADALFPVMGPAIRKAIASALGAMVQSINQALEHSLSLQGLKWRFEAARTGRSFGEVVLLHTLLYRVEHVFLVHKETGLPLQHRTLPGVTAPDSGMVSGMLTAIQDFVRDSFGAGRMETLDSFQVGELAVWVEAGPVAALAAVIRGTPLQTLRVELQQALERIHREQHGALASFSGDPAPFAACEEALDACLRVHHAGPAAGSGKRKLRLLLIGGAALAVILTLWAGFSWRDGRRWAAYVDGLKGEPGIVVTSVGRRDGRYFVAGLRDPLAADPADRLRATGIDPGTVIGRWEPYHSLLPQFMLARARALLEPPPTVTLALEGDVLWARGWATREFIAEARRRTRAIPGVTRLRDDELMDAGLQSLGLLKQRIEAREIRFERGSATPGPGQSEILTALTADIRSLNEAAVAAEERVRVEIVGHTDPDASPDLNMKLSQRRAAHVAGLLDVKSRRAIETAVSGGGAVARPSGEPTEDAKAASRKVTFRVLVRGGTSAEPEPR